MLLPPAMPTSGKARVFKGRSPASPWPRRRISKRKATSPIETLNTQRKICGSSRVAKCATAQVISVPETPIIKALRSASGCRWL
jgi:hypothetical protein